MSRHTVRYPTPPADGLVTVAEAGRHLRLSRTTIYVLMGSGHLAFVKIGRARRIARASLAELIRANTRTEPLAAVPTGGRRG